MYPRVVLYIYIVILKFKNIKEQIFSPYFHGIRANLLLKVIRLFLVSSTKNLFCRTIRLLVGGFDVRNQWKWEFWRFFTIGINTFISSFPHGTSDNPSLHITTHKLNGLNFLRWSQFVKLLIRGKWKLGYLIGVTNAPKNDDSGFQTWDLKHSMIMAWLVNSMELQIGQTYIFFTYSKRTLESSYRNLLQYWEFNTNLWVEIKDPWNKIRRSRCD